ncbi:peptidase S8 and S53 subtilisin kexin sedolisin [Ruminiclostridium papyrosolvens DSM 2782]|uniref:Peptidase S8 and S53 subtilisin kexin sedolisin n=1 Tax=Ruminiclostridium papyrosolvens DSM 2782 TaxID=588581 RepID=F1TI05_9FIRM|nr:S8 family peptidase [Ruminiclostridium papyrosolvens]EGD45940.1 peptidase S8 and S53 subtilisin kexin sedolisin [Ruminiclostridium papyrosolvens DSM 2782]WES33670.1 S8 family peptidase [Ruminiclostridium papyrosolvens DSM 2782]
MSKAIKCFSFVIMVIFLLHTNLFTVASTGLETSQNANYNNKIVAKNKTKTAIKERNTTEKKQNQMQIEIEETSSEDTQPTKNYSESTAVNQFGDSKTESYSDFETDRLIIKYKNKDSNFNADEFFEKVDKELKLKIKKDYKHNNFEFIVLDKKCKLNDLADDIKKQDLNNDIQYIQPDYQLSLSTNDSYYSSQWGVENNLVVYDEKSSEQINSYICDSNIVEAWRKSTGNGAVIAVIDTGVEATHEDLAQNIWVNTKEIPGNGIDDDGNGKIDDINGWNFIDNSNAVYDTLNISDENHGTHIAGIIAAVKDNGKGIAGVAPSAKILPLKVFNNGKAYTSDIMLAIQYAENIGVKIVNCSWGSTDKNPSLEEVIQNSSMLFVCAAGNSSADIDNVPVYPADFDCPNIIVVASVNKNGILSGFSNYGEKNVDVAAPGDGIISTLPSNSYGEMSGTSMATAFVSGEAALMSANIPDINSVDLKEGIIRCSDHLSSLSGKVSGSSKINCVNSLNNHSTDKIIDVPDISVVQNGIVLTEQLDIGEKEFSEDDNSSYEIPVESVITYVYDDNNRLIEIWKGNAQIYKFIYDNNGNLIRKQKL